MKFIVEPKVFDLLPDVCIGVVAAKGVDNGRAYPEIDAMLDRAIERAQERFLDKKVKEEPAILPYRQAFQQLGINPNKYMCSIEALFARIAKGKGMPHINPLVDLNNAISLQDTLPMGTHDLGASDLDIEMRFAKEGDVFLPFGSEETEAPDAGELVYAVGNDVRTRRWTWRQSEHGKIGADTNYVFFPIDGFVGTNDDRVRAAMDSVEEIVTSVFGGKTRKGFIDKHNHSVDLSL